jgi:hypothetical protein
MRPSDSEQPSRTWLKAAAAALVVVGVVAFYLHGQRLNDEARRVCLFAQSHGYDQPLDACIRDMADESRRAMLKASYNLH